MDENNSKELEAILEELDLLKYSYLFDDNKNMIPFVEEIIVCKNDDVEMFLEMLKLETKIEKIEEGKFSKRINQRYLIVYDYLKFEMKDIVRNFLFKIKTHLKDKFFDCIYPNVSSANEFLKNVVTFVNFILLFSPEFSTIYNLKKQILSDMINKKQNCDELIHSEFMFVNVMNEKFRKCSISWDYRLFLIKYLFEIPDKNSSFIEKYLNYDEKILTLLKYLNPLSEIFDQLRNVINLLKNSKNLKILLLDLYFIFKINQRDKRNYHLWKYLVHIFNLFYSDVTNHISELILIYSFCLVNFLNYPLDYSAYSNSINFYKKLNDQITQEELQKLKSYLHKIKCYMPEENNSKYLKSLIESYFN